MTTAQSTSSDAAAMREASRPAIDPALHDKLRMLRAQLREAFGNVVVSMMALPRYRDQTLGDLQHLVLEPLLQDRIAMAYAGETHGAPGQELAGIALWASVSEEVDASIQRQIRAGVFPLRLKPEDWTSGSINWLFDVIAADQTMVARVLANFRQVVKEGGLRLHPLITHLVDAETLRKMGAHRGGSETQASADAAN